jgi:hypothetical protein
MRHRFGVRKLTRSYTALAQETSVKALPEFKDK